MPMCGGACPSWRTSALPTHSDGPELITAGGQPSKLGKEWRDGGREGAPEGWDAPEVGKKGKGHGEAARPTGGDEPGKLELADREQRVEGRR